MNNVDNTKNIAFWKTILLVLMKFIGSIVIAVLLAKLTWLIVSPERVIVSGVKEIQSINSKHISQNTSYNISETHLFGELDVIETKPVEVVDAPETKLKLILLGVLSAHSSTESSAIISEISRKGKVYKIGDKVYGRTKLSSVYADRVVLDTLGILETLMFVNKKNPGFVSNAKDNKNSLYTPTKSNKISINSKARSVSILQNEFKKNPIQILTSLGIKAVKGSGYKVVNQTPMLANVGLKKGDVILSLNDMALGDIEKDTEIMTDVYKTGKIKIKVKRGSSQLVVNHVIKK
jgi:general secretion pathway protein C